MGTVEKKLFKQSETFKLLNKIKINRHNYEELYKLLNNIDTKADLSRLRDKLILKRIEVEGLELDLLTIEGLASRLMKEDKYGIMTKEKYDMEAKLNDRVDSVIEHLEMRETLEQMLNELGISEKQLEQEILKNDALNKCQELEES